MPEEASRVLLAPRVVAARLMAPLAEMLPLIFTDEAAVAVMAPLAVIESVAWLPRVNTPVLRKFKAVLETIVAPVKLTA